MTESTEIFHRPIYMDHHATTPVDRRVLEAMLPYFTDNYGNAASVDHIYGLEANQAVDEARSQISRAIHSKPEEILFTSGATESNNLAILGVAKRYAIKGNHIITCVTEHPAILDPCKYLENNGYDITYLSVDNSGLINPDDIREAITSKTILISVMTANNEIGTLQPIDEIGLIARDHEVLFHTDATQAIGYVSINIDSMGIDLLSISGHKIYGPKGIGALYVRKTKPRVKLSPIFHGGGHEKGMRSGTMNVPGIVGLGAAVEIAINESEDEGGRISGVRDSLLNGLRERIENVQINGHLTKRLPNNLNVAFLGIESRSLLVQLKGVVAISTGSACTTAKVEPSHVILALGYGKTRAHQSVRFGLGRSNTRADVDIVIERVSQAVRKLQALSFA